MTRFEKYILKNRLYEYFERLRPKAFKAMIGMPTKDLFEDIEHFKEMQRIGGVVSLNILPEWSKKYQTTNTRNLEQLADNIATTVKILSGFTSGGNVDDRYLEIEEEPTRQLVADWFVNGNSERTGVSIVLAHINDDLDTILSLRESISPDVHPIVLGRLASMENDLIQLVNLYAEIALHSLTK